MEVLNRVYTHKEWLVGDDGTIFNKRWKQMHISQEVLRPFYLNYLIKSSVRIRLVLGGHRNM